MKIKKLALICMTALLFVVGVPKTAMAAGNACGDSCSYRYDSVKKELTITGTGKITSNPWQSSYGKEIQSVVIGEGITELGAICLFENCTSLRTVKLPQTVKKISDWDFRNCTSLTEVNLPDSLEEIGVAAFEGCTGLKSITIPKNLKKSGGNCFNGSGVQTVTFAEGTTEIPFMLFIDCNTLETIHFPKTVTKIKDWAFANCTSLTEVTLPVSLEELGVGAFEGCTGIKNITIPKTLKESGGNCFNGSGVQTVNFEEGIKEVPFSLFKDCDTLTTIKFPQTIEFIRDWAFANCTSLTEVTLPWYLETIGVGAFENCTNLKKVTIYQKVTTIKNAAFNNVKDLTVYGKKGTTAQKFAKANNYTFKACKIPALKGITYKKGSLKYKVVKDYANNKGTVMVTGLSKKNLSSVTIPDKVKLESYNYKVVKIDKKAFYKQSKLKKITIKANSITSMGKNAFSKINSKATVYVPKQKYSKYKSLLKKAGLSKKVIIKKK